MRYMRTRTTPTVMILYYYRDDRQIALNVSILYYNILYYVYTCTDSLSVSLLYSRGISCRLITCILHFKRQGFKDYALFKFIFSPKI